jgi:hypothetical protein
MRMPKRLIFGGMLFIVPLAAWALIKPLRVLAPQLEGLTCDEWVCVDDTSRRAEATRLCRDALDSVQASVGALYSVPRAVLCATPACSDKFGFKAALAYDVGTFAIVISHRGWRPYLIRHELINHLQNERLGWLRARLFKPEWWREGMAYSMSRDPRKLLPEPLEGYRSQFEVWFKQVGPERLWAEAEHL